MITFLEVYNKEIYTRREDQDSNIIITSFVIAKTGKNREQLSVDF